MKKIMALLLVLSAAAGMSEKAEAASQQPEYGICIGSDGVHAYMTSGGFYWSEPGYCHHPKCYNDCKYCKKHYKELEKRHKKWLKEQKKRQKECRKVKCHQDKNWHKTHPGRPHGHGKHHRR